MSRSIARPRVDLPQPDSPTSPRVSRSLISSEKPSTAFTTRFTGLLKINLSSGPPPPRSKCTFRSLIESNVELFELILRPVYLRIHCRLRVRNDRVSGDPGRVLRKVETRGDKSPGR